MPAIWKTPTPEVPSQAKPLEISIRPVLCFSFGLVSLSDTSAKRWPVLGDSSLKNRLGRQRYGVHRPGHEASAETGTRGIHRYPPLPTALSPAFHQTQAPVPKTPPTPFPKTPHRVYRKLPPLCSEKHCRCFPKHSATRFFLGNLRKRQGAWELTERCLGFVPVISCGS